MERKRVLNLKDIEGTVKYLLQEQTGVNAKKITAVTGFEDDLGFDSFDALVFAGELETVFNIEMEDIWSLKTVGELVEYLQKELT